MEVYALIGPSGTGKSHHAMEVAQDYGVEYIIDDGLLIHKGKKIAGISAKSEQTMVAAVKCAIFFDSKRAELMRDTLAKEKPKKLLILGTSEHMIDRIIQTLGLPQIKEKIFIYDVVSPEELSIAREMRMDGKHVIPLPAIEVRKDFPNFWIDPIVGLFKWKNKKENDEKSIIRPVFSQLGKVTISEQVVIQLVHHLAKKNPRLNGHCKSNVKLTNMGVQIQCEARVRFGTPIQHEIASFQEQVISEIESLTGLTVQNIDVRIVGIYKE